MCDSNNKKYVAGSEWVPVPDTLLLLGIQVWINAQNELAALIWGRFRTGFKSINELKVYSK